MLEWSIRIMMAGKDGGSTDPDLNTGAYHDSNEVDKTTMEGQVTNVGDRISWTTGIYIMMCVVYWS